LVATLDALQAGELHPVAQPAEGVSLAPKITVEDARIRWGTPALAVDRQIRGCTPAPGAWTRFRGERLKIHPVTIALDVQGHIRDALVESGEVAAPLVTAPGVGTPELLAPGEVDATKRAVRVGTASGAVLLGVVQPQGKKPMAAADWARGVRPEPGEVLGGE
jgi:methionyl-tRNA formyltransferase